MSKTAIVTGSSKGIGLATVNLLLEKGFKVVGWSRSATPITHDNFKSLQVDVSNFNAVEQALKESFTFLNQQIDLLLNSAGFGIQDPILTSTPSNFDAMIDTNVKGLYYCTRVVAPLMKEKGSGHIFNIASIAGTTGIETMSGYCASKYAVRGFSQSIYKELRRFGIKVTCINPGSVNTNFFDDFKEIEADDTMMQPQDIASAILHAYETQQNFHVVELEMRPLNR